MACKKTLLVIPCFMKSRRRYETTECQVFDVELRKNKQFSVVSKELLLQ